MDEQQSTWTSEEAMGNLESLTRLEWNRKLPEGVRELLETYEAAIPQLAAEIRRLRGELREERRKQSGEESPEGPESEDSENTTGYEDLADFARRLGLDQR